MDILESELGEREERIRGQHLRPSRPQLSSSSPSSRQHIPSTLLPVPCRPRPSTLPVRTRGARQGLRRHPSPRPSPGNRSSSLRRPQHRSPRPTPASSSTTHRRSPASRAPFGAQPTCCQAGLKAPRSPVREVSLVPLDRASPRPGWTRLSWDVVPGGKTRSRQEHWSIWM